MHEIFRHSTFASTTIPHYTTADTVLNGHKVSKNMLVFINQYAANHDPTQWSDPDDFKPERFLDSEGKLIEKAHDRYLIFSYGSRKCPGDELTRLVFLQLMAIFLTLCEFKSDPKNPVSLEGVYNLSTRPKLLRTRIRIRKPELFDIVLTDRHHLSPHVQTVNSKTLSFVSSSSSESLSSSEELMSEEDVGVPQQQHQKFTNAQYEPEEFFKPTPFQVGVGLVADIIPPTRSRE